MKKQIKAIDTHLAVKTSYTVALGTIFLITVSMAVLPILLGLSTALFAISLSQWR